MTDPTDPLAHLYGDVTAEDFGDLEIPLRTTSLDELVEETGEVEEISDDDVAQLALMVKDAQTAGTSSDEFLEDLGLGEFHDVEGEPHFDLNAVGRRVTRHLAEAEGLIPRGTAPPG